MNAKGEVLFVDDEEDIRLAVDQMLSLAGFCARTASSAEKALSIISNTYAGILVCDIRMPGTDGLGLLHKTLSIDPDLPVVLVTGHGDVELAVSAMREGAYDFIEKPFSEERFLDAVARALEKRLLTLENRRLRSSANSQSDDLYEQISGQSETISEVRKLIRAIAPTSADVLIVGETGTGKEVAARAIHSLSCGDTLPFMAINCAALPRDMIEAELFGYDAGAFPGATRTRFGKLEHARNGTIFLDEIETMPLDVQAKLLRVIEERSVTRLGSNEPIALNARFIAASSIDLEQSAGEGTFRKDLLYRLNVSTLRMPPLSQRRQDIPELFIKLVHQAAAKMQATPQHPSDALLSRLSAQSWPGNVRELRNAADRFALGIDMADADQSELGATLPDRMSAFERQAIINELRTRGGNLKSTYEALGLSRKTLYEKMQKYELSRDQFRHKNSPVTD